LATKDIERIVMRALVTGGCGFIGSHLVKTLVARKDDVIVLDDFSTGRIENIPQSVRVITGDVADEKTIEAALQNIDVCFHLAAIASIPLYRDKWYAAHRVNQLGLVNILDKICKKAAKTGAPTPVIYASSAAVYGDKDPLPGQEKLPVHPLSSYGLDKYGCELQARLASDLYNIPTLGLRFFNVFGPGQVSDFSHSGVVSNFISHALTKKTLCIHGNGLQERDFVYVDDAVTAIIAAEKRVTCPGNVFNVCTGRATSILSLAQTINALCRSNTPIDFVLPRKDDIRQSIGDASLAKESLGFEASVFLEEGLRRTIDSFKP
jgi:UDP-glucose 4-epimerase